MGTHSLHRFSTSIPKHIHSLEKMPSTNFKNTPILSEITQAAENHRQQQLNFRFKGHQMLKLLENLEVTPETERLIKAAFREALDKRPMADQLTLKAKFQKSHGLVFKDIPLEVERTTIFNAITKLGRTMDFKNGQLMFPGGCKMRSFFFPDAKRKQGATSRVCFPIFVNKKDQMYIYQWAQNQNGKIQLEIEGDKSGWDGVVSVELTRDEARESDEENNNNAFQLRSRMNSVSSGFYSPVGIQTPPLPNLQIPYLQAFSPYLLAGSSQSSLGSSPVPDLSNTNFPPL